MLLQQARRLFDQKPWAAHLYVTDQCNLDCHYCNEYDNSIPHPKLEDLKVYMDKIRELGAIRLGLQGGEPLMHPDICEIVRYAREIGFGEVSMSSNALLLSEQMAKDLDAAGLTKFQFSIDRMTPIPSTRKSLKSVAHKFAFFKGTGIKIQVSGVLFEDTLEEMEEVIEHCIGEGVPAHARVAHDDLIDGKAIDLGDSVKPLLDFLDMEERRKLRGEVVRSDWNLIDYQRALLTGERIDWKCVAGYKYFFVSAQGKFWLCSQVRTDVDITDVTPQMLQAYNTKKDCQDGCGVYCIVQMSLMVNNPARFFAVEARGRAVEKLYGLGRHPALPHNGSVPDSAAPVSEARGKLYQIGVRR